MACVYKQNQNTNFSEGSALYSEVSKQQQLQQGLLLKADIRYVSTNRTKIQTFLKALLCTLYSVQWSLKSAAAAARSLIKSSPRRSLSLSLAAVGRQERVFLLFYFLFLIKGLHHCSLPLSLWPRSLLLLFSFLMSYTLFLISQFLFLISYFLILISHLLLLISYLLSLIS